MPGKDGEAGLPGQPGDILVGWNGNVFFVNCIFKYFFNSLFQERKETLDFLESRATWDHLVRKAVLERWVSLVRAK